MASSTKPTSIRLTDVEKRRIGAAAKKRGMSPAAYIKRAALEGVGQSDEHP
jgi:predicted DNA-binding protein